MSVNDAGCGIIIHSSVNKNKSLPSRILISDVSIIINYIDIYRLHIQSYKDAIIIYIGHLRSQHSLSSRLFLNYDSNYYSTERSFIDTCMSKS